MRIPCPKIFLNFSTLFGCALFRNFLLFLSFFCAKKRVSHIGFRCTSLAVSLSPSLTLSSPRQGSPFFGFRFVSFGFVELSFMLCLHSHTKGLNGILKEYGKRIASNRKNPEANRFFFFSLIFLLVFFLGINSSIC